MRYTEPTKLFSVGCNVREVILAAQKSMRRILVSSSVFVVATDTAAGVLLSSTPIIDTVVVDMLFERLASASCRWHAAVLRIAFGLKLKPHRGRGRSFGMGHTVAWRRVRLDSRHPGQRVRSVASQQFVEGTTPLAELHALAGGFCR